jgi:hypothetical protein
MEERLSLLPAFLVLTSSRLARSTTRRDFLRHFLKVAETSLRVGILVETGDPSTPSCWGLCDRGMEEVRPPDICVPRSVASCASVWDTPVELSLVEDSRRRSVDDIFPDTELGRMLDTSRERKDELWEASSLGPYVGVEKCKDWIGSSFVVSCDIKDSRGLMPPIEKYSWPQRLQWILFSCLPSREMWSSILEAFAQWWQFRQV